MSQKSALTAPGGMTQDLVGMGVVGSTVALPLPSVCSPRLFCSGRSSVRLEYLDLSELPGMVEESSCFGADNLQGNERSIFVFVEALLSYFMTQTCFFQVHCQNTL